MIELPNGTISRTLAEQVGFNSAKIAEIIKFLNESGLKDLVINLESDSGTLSTDQYAIAELSPSYMVYDGGVFYKVFEDADYIDYFLLMENIDTSNSDLDVSRWRIRVERDSRNYALDNVGIFTSYNKDQIDSIVLSLNSALDTKANLSEANFTGAITSPSIIENMSGYSAEISANLDTWDKTIAYCGAVKTGNKLTLVISLKLTRRSTTTDLNPQVIIWYIPESVLNKIFPITIDGYNWVDQKNILAFKNATESVSVPARLGKGANNLRLQIGAGTLVQDTEYVLRYEATFLLNDSLI